MSFVISNIVTCALPPKTAFNLSSALILRLFASSCSLCFLMYSQIFFVTSVRGIGAAPITAANTGDKVIGFMKAAFGLRGAAAGFAAALAGFAAGLAAAFATGFFAAAGFAAAFAAGLAAGFAAAFFGAVAILRLLHNCLGKCAISRSAYSGADYRAMQVFFFAFCEKSVRNHARRGFQREKCRFSSAE